MNRMDRTLKRVQGESKVSVNRTSAHFPKKDDDIVVVSALRSPIGRARRGNLRETFVEDMLSQVLKETLKRTKLDPKSVGDIVVGSVLGVGTQRANECRMAAFLAGFPSSVPVHLVNRQCSSGLQAIAHCAANIKAGYYDIGLGCGVESMSLSTFRGWNGDVNPQVFMNKQAKACMLPMGITSENVARKFGVTRKEQDELAVRSHQRAIAATKDGRFSQEIVPITTKVTDKKKGKTVNVVVKHDEGMRPGTTFEGLSKLRPVFDKKGSTTAGNASQVSDGAAVVVVMKRSKARELGMKVMGTLRSFAVTGVDPKIMGIGPATAIPAAVKQAGLKIGDIDLFEINEAFASQAVYCVKKLGLSWDKVNVNGGAIAIGHPLGMTGARMTATLLHEMARRGDKLGIVSMCIGSGMGAAAVYECE